MRLIDADALEGKILMDAPGFIDGGSEITKAFILAMIKTRSVTPTVDAIPVVRCKDCRHGVLLDDSNYYVCSRPFASNRETHTADWFCADGKAK